jgi:hypothetical protein
MSDIVGKQEEQGCSGDSDLPYPASRTVTKSTLYIWLDGLVLEFGIR